MSNEEPKNQTNELKNLLNKLQITTSSYSLSKKDIKQDDISDRKINNNNKIVNNKFHDDYENFDEIEDENGNVLLVKYFQETEFRGNKYYIYILINEKTGYKEKGIAQEKNGQKIFVKDKQKIIKIQEKIINKYFKRCNYDANIIDTKIDEEQELFVLCKNKNLPYFYSIISGYGTYKEEYLSENSGNKEFLNKVIKLFNLSESEIERDRLGIFTYNFNGQELKLQYLTRKHICFKVFYKLCQVVNTNKYIVFIENSENKLQVLNKISTDLKNSLWQDTYLDDDNRCLIKDLMQNGVNIALENTQNNNDTKISQKNNFLKIALFLPLCIFLIYPLSELILWFLAHIAPIFWADKFSTEGITNFAIQHLPYAYHPELKWYSHFAVNMVSGIIFSVITFFFNPIFENENKKYHIIIGLFDILALFFLYAMFVANVFNMVGNISFWTIIASVVLIIIATKISF